MGASPAQRKLPFAVMAHQLRLHGLPPTCSLGELEDGLVCVCVCPTLFSLVENLNTYVFPDLSGSTMQVAEIGMRGLRYRIILKSPRMKERA